MINDSTVYVAFRGERLAQLYIGLENKVNLQLRMLSSHMCAKGVVGVCQATPDSALYKETAQSSGNWPCMAQGELRPCIYHHGMLRRARSLDGSVTVQA